MKLPKLPKAQNHDLQVAKNNTSVLRTTREGKDVLKQGTPQDAQRLYDDGDKDRVGMNIGVTKNMGEYESLRVDAWFTTNVDPDETVKETYDYVRRLLGKVLVDTIEDYMPK